jgi:hypothetical protein
VFIEEAAGISKYKERRTRNRVAHAPHAREPRAPDRPARRARRQLQHLQRQAQAAEKYKALKEEERHAQAAAGGGAVARRWTAGQPRVGGWASSRCLESVYAEQQSVDTSSKSSASSRPSAATRWPRCRRATTRRRRGQSHRAGDPSPGRSVREQIRADLAQATRGPGAGAAPPRGGRRAPGGLGRGAGGSWTPAAGSAARRSEAGRATLQAPRRDAVLAVRWDEFNQQRGAAAAAGRGAAVADPAPRALPVSPAKRAWSSSSRSEQRRDRATATRCWSHCAAAGAVPRRSWPRRAAR